ncbi:MAG: electron transport complex subunit RsxG [Gammaproteobacteria bacterium]|nr:electron transport complex subunit RsxG [Gammaproteobacteria bacterium]
MVPEGRGPLVAGGVLAAAAFAGTLLLAVTDSHTAPYIAANEYARMLRQLTAVMPAGGYDNDPVGDTRALRDPDLLGTPEAVKVYRACRQGRPVAVAFAVVAPDGYGGPIRLMVGISAAGVVSGVRVLHHRETPGLGDDIETRHSDWIESFRGTFRGAPPDKDWKVKRDGGVFDQFTGATVTPRAVVAAVHRALVFFQRHRDELLHGDPPPPPATTPGDPS